MKTCILVSVWPDYRWLVPLFHEMLNTFWQGHPEVFFTHERGDGMNWTHNLLTGLEDVKAAGYNSVYLINEEHVPISKCNNNYLSKTLIYQAHELNASYVSLFGWDNKRFCSKSDRLGKEHGMWMLLNSSNDPRFHLHPAWWRVDILEECCRLVLRNVKGNGSAWHFEKTCDDAEVVLSHNFQERCYQICAGMSRDTPLSSSQMWCRLASRWFFNKAMAFLPHLKGKYLRSVWLKLCDFDSVISDGAYPMVFSGIMAKGKLNPAFIKAISQIQGGSYWRNRILCEFKQNNYKK